MEKYLEILMACPLFSGIEACDLTGLLQCLGAVERQIAKNNFVFTAGDTVSTIGVVLSGSVHVMQEDFWGNRAILAGIGPGGLFGEAFSCAGQRRLPVSVRAVQPTQLLLIDCRKVITTCPSACGFHTRLVQNLLQILAEKNIMLTQKMEILTRRTTREKLLAYLSAEAARAGGRAFSIPFDRQELADYLSVDRSAMSNELSKMQREGILTFHRNAFELL